jgi:hypothetical protein
MSSPIEDSENISEKQKSINQLTLETFMNKTHYQKYIAKTNPTKHLHNQRFLADLKKYRGTILTMTDDLLENPMESISSEINELFEKYASSVIDYLKYKELDRNTLSNDDEVLFGEMDEHTTTTSSFWGKDTVKKRRNRVGTIDDVLFQGHMKK